VYEIFIYCSPPPAASLFNSTLLHLSIPLLLHTLAHHVYLYVNKKLLIGDNAQSKELTILDNLPK